MSKIRSFDEYVKRSRSLEIDINGNDISDVICIYEGKVTNMMTGKTSTQNVNDVIRDKRFIVVNRSKCHIIYGYYAYYDQEYEMVVLIDVVFNWNTGKWEESQDMDGSRSFMCRYYASYYSNNWRELSNAIDICGQAMTDRVNMNYPVGSRQVFQKVFGRFAYASHDDCDTLHFTQQLNPYNDENLKDLLLRNMPFTLGDIYQIRYENETVMFEEKNKVSSKKISAVYLEGNEACNKIAPGENIPKEALGFAEKMGKKYLSSVNGSIYRLNNLNKDSEFCILQKIGDDVVQRCFFFYFDYQCPFEDSKAVIVEFNRFILGESNDFLHLPVIWCDDLKGTPFAYAKPYVDKAVRILDELMEKLDDIAKIKDEADKKIFVEIGASIDSVVLLLVSMQFSIFEAVYKFMCESCFFNQFKSEIIKNIQKACNNMSRTTFLERIVYSSMRNVLGGLKEESSIYDILEVPKAMIKAIEEKCGQPRKTERGTNILYAIKLMFGADNDAQMYLRRMDKKTAEEIVCWMEVIIQEKHFDMLEYILSGMSYVFGYQNHTKYLEYLYELTDKESDYYANYIETARYMVRTSSKWEKVIRDIGWKIQKDNLVKMSAFVDMLSQIRDNYEDFERKFNSHKEEWEKLVYQNDKLIIRYPKEPLEIVMEGTTLNHCAKDFVEPVADGKTIILFLREVEKPDIPYYTVEIRNGIIRQIHGFNNKNMEEGSDESIFIKEFCDKKGIAITPQEINELLGV